MTIIENFSDFFITDDFAETVSYTAEGGAPVDILAIVNTDFPRQEDYDRGIKYAVAVIEVHSSQVSAPSGRDRYTFGGHEWAIGADGYQTSGDFLTVNLIRMLTE